jgi:hypothetical protein
VQKAPSKESLPAANLKMEISPSVQVPADKTFQKYSNIPKTFQSKGPKPSNPKANFPKTFQKHSNIPKTFQKPSKPCGVFGGLEYFSYLCTVNSKAGQREATPESSYTSLNTPRLQGPEPSAKQERIRRRLILSDDARNPAHPQRNWGNS